MKFKDLQLGEAIQDSLKKFNYVQPTPIQEQTIPLILERNDVLGIAQTGTGKTAAFTLPLLELMSKNKKEGKTPVKTLILAPTRELAAQIGDSIKKYSTHSKISYSVIFGGVSQRPQEKELERGVDIIVATPGRLLDLINQRIVDLSSIEYLVLDEADRMLDMGFINDIKKILLKMPKKRQTLFFSATMSKPILELSRTMLNNPKKVEITPISTTTAKIIQGLYYVDKENKDKLLLELIVSEKMDRTIVFTRTKHKSNKIATFLNKNNIRAEAIHGNKSQNHRTKTLKEFKEGIIKVLVATEIVARGIDIDNISHVINYEIPNEPESYVHRIGRTARAGKDGEAYSFCAADEKNYILEIEKIIKKQIPVMEHKLHSDSAQNAKGSAAKPAPKEKFHRKPSGNGGGSSKKGSYSKGNSKKSSYKPKKKY
jgi:ATP-dependent RNA helicase RhlE